MNVTLDARPPLMVPVLPLEGHVLLPAAATPYRVSDPRHRRLVQDLLDRPADQRWVAVPARGAQVARLVEPEPVDSGGSSEPAEPAEPAEIGALGLVTVATPLEGGDFIVVIEGRSACRLEPLDGAHPFAVPYAMAKIRHLGDRPEPLGRARAATTGLIQALFGLYESFGLGASELPQSDLALDDCGLVYRIGSAVIQDPAARALLLGERCPARRRSMVEAYIIDQMAFAVRERLLGRAAAPC